MTERKARHARPEPASGAQPGAAPEFVPGPPPETTPGMPAEITPGTAQGSPGMPAEATPGTAGWSQGTQGGYWAARPETWTVRGTYGPDIDIGNIPRPAAGARARLASDPRMPAWIWRAVASAGAGIIISALVDWRFGLTAAVAVAIADTIHRSRTSAAIPAAVRAPSAHRRTRRRLARLDRAGYRALHARAVPGSPYVIDHLVIGPGGVYTVDSERWDRRLPVRASQGGKLYHGPFSQAGRLTDTLLAADEAGRMVSAALGRQLAVQPTMAIYGPTIPWTVASVGGVDVFGGRRLRKYLYQHMKARSAEPLDSGEIERIYAAAAHVLPPAH